MKKNLIIAGTILFCIVLVGSGGLFFLGWLAGTYPRWSLADTFYMTIITLTTVGFGEIIDVGSVPGARLYTVFILFCGLGVSAYFISTLTAFLVEGDLKNLFWRKKMTREIDKLNGHTIICGAGRVGRFVLTEFLASKRSFVLIDQQEELVMELQEAHGPFPALVEDATHEAGLKKAGVERASGIISALGDDKDNLCVTVTCRQLNPGVRVISRCKDREFAGKLELIGAQVVIPNFIGGLRIASQMLRPRVVNYLDTMLRDKDYVVRIEELTVPAGSDLVDSTVADLQLSGYGNLLLLAVLGPDRSMPVYNPEPSYVIRAGDTLVFQAYADAIERFRRKHT